MTGALLLGAVAGLGLIVIAAGLTPRRISLAEALDAFNREPRPPLVPAEEGGCASTFPSGAIVIKSGVAAVGVTVVWSAIALCAFVAKESLAVSAGCPSGVIAGSGVLESGASERRKEEAVAAAFPPAGWNELPPNIGVELTGVVGAAVLVAPAASDVFRRSPRATRIVPLACSTLIGLVSTRLAPMR